jgi:hypothetical protein
MNMGEKIFHREEYPFDILADFGLSEEMIYDLPDYVHTIIEMGGKSPLLPIAIEQPFGVTRAYAKFCLLETEDGLDVLFTPKLKQVNLEAFTKSDQKRLLEGKVIVTDIDDVVRQIDGTEESQRIRAFVQLDKDTNDVVYSPTQIIGRNISAICTEYELTGKDLQSFWNGNLVTVLTDKEEGAKEPITIGVDLFSDKGIIVVPGTAEQWENTVRRVMPEYSFGNDGCWINRNGRLSYVPEEEFDEQILSVLEKQAAKNGFTPDGDEQELLQYQSQREYEAAQQITR